MVIGKVRYLECHTDPLYWGVGFGLTTSSRAMMEMTDWALRSSAHTPNIVFTSSQRTNNTDVAFM